MNDRTARTRTRKHTHAQNRGKGTPNKTQENPTHPLQKQGHDAVKCIMVPPPPTAGPLGSHHSRRSVTEGSNSAMSDWMLAVCVTGLPRRSRRLSLGQEASGARSTILEISARSGLRKTQPCLCPISVAVELLLTLDIGANHCSTIKTHQLPRSHTLKGTFCIVMKRICPLNSSAPMYSKCDLS